MYGWRGRIGLIVPSSNTTMECELIKMLPKGVSLHTSRVMQTIETEEELMRMAEYAMRAGQELESADVDLILYGCTSGSFLKGEAWNKEFTQKLSKSVGKPVVTTSTAVSEALKNLRIGEICLVTPYPEETNLKAVLWLESLGLKVVKTIELIKSTYEQPISNLEIGRLVPELVYSKVKKGYPSNSDGVFISCTNLRALEIIEVIEADLGTPVVTSNQASMWWVLKILGYTDSFVGFGGLFKKQSV